MKILFSFRLGKKAKMAPMPNCQTLNGDKKKIASWVTEVSIEIKNKVKINEKTEINTIDINLKLNDLKNLKTIYKKIG